MLLLHQVVATCDFIVTISLDTLDRVIRIKIKFLQYLLVDLIIHRHELFLREQPDRRSVLKLLKPGVDPYLRNAVSLNWVYHENFAQQMRTVSSQKFGYFVIPR